MFYLFVSFPPFPDLFLLSLFTQSRGHLYPPWERQEEPSNLRPVYHFKVCNCKAEKACTVKQKHENSVATLNFCFNGNPYANVQVYGGSWEALC